MKKQRLRKVKVTKGGTTRNRTHLLYNTADPGGDGSKGKSREPAWKHVAVDEV